MPGTIKIKLIRSTICTPEKHKIIVRALGLKKMNRDGGASRYAGLPRHGEEGPAPFGDRRKVVRRKNWSIMNLSQLKPPAGQKHKEAARRARAWAPAAASFRAAAPRAPSPISGYSRMRGFEGGQMPLHRRLPKRGFTNIFRKEFAIVNVGALEALEGDSFRPASLLEAGVIHKLKDGLKILGTGELKRKITVQAHIFSKSALEKIQAAGGSGGSDCAPEPRRARDRVSCDSLWE